MDKCHHLKNETACYQQAISKTAKPYI